MKSTTPNSFNAPVYFRSMVIASRPVFEVGVRLFICVLFVVMTACTPKPEVTDQNVVVIDDVALAELIKSPKGVVLIDVRPDYRYRQGRLPGAINIPLPELTHTDARLTDKKPVVVYGDGPRNTLSHAAAKKLLVGGKLAVSDFRGGMEAWKQAGREVVTAD